MNWREVEPDGASPREKAWQRAERVLAHPDIAAQLTRPPLSLPDPRMWSGYIPPSEWRGQLNDSPVRRQLIAICKQVAEREEQANKQGLGQDEGDPVAPELITGAQLTKLHACLSDYGITDRDEKLFYLSAETDRQVESSKDLTKAEASLIIDRLEQLIRFEDEHNLKGITDVAGGNDATADQGTTDRGRADAGREPADQAGENDAGSGQAEDFPPY